MVLRVRTFSQRGDEFAVVLQLGWGQDAGHASVSAAQGPCAGSSAHGPVDGCRGHAVQVGRFLYELFPLATFCEGPLQPLAKLDECLTSSGLRTMPVPPVRPVA